MSHSTDQQLEGYERALGLRTMHALDDRELLHTAHVTDPLTDDPDEIGERIHGTVMGLVLGDALGYRLRHARPNDRKPLEDFVYAWLTGRRTSVAEDRLTYASQTFAVAADDLLDDEYSAPMEIGCDLMRRRSTLRAPGNALVTAMANIERGVQWDQAAPPSYGDGALPRAVAAGLANAGSPERAGLAGSLDAVATHAHPIAAGASALLATTIAAMVRRPSDAVPAELVRRVAASSSEAHVGHRIETIFAGEAEVPEPFTAHADDALGIALLAMNYDDFRDVLSVAAAMSANDRVVLAITGAIYGSVYGNGRIPDRKFDVEGHAAFQNLATHLTNRATVLREVR